MSAQEGQGLADDLPRPGAVVLEVEGVRPFGVIDEGHGEVPTESRRQKAIHRLVEVWKLLPPSLAAIPEAAISRAQEVVAPNSLKEQPANRRKPGSGSSFADANAHGSASVPDRPVGGALFGFQFFFVGMPEL